MESRCERKKEKERGIEGEGEREREREQEEVGGCLVRKRGLAGSVTGHKPSSVSEIVRSPARACAPLRNACGPSAVSSCRSLLLNTLNATGSPVTGTQRGCSDAGVTGDRVLILFKL